MRWINTTVPISPAKSATLPFTQTIFPFFFLRLNCW